MLLYSLLHLTGYDLSIDDLKTSASCTAKPWPSGIPIPRASKPPPARSVRASPTPVGMAPAEKVLAAIQPRRSTVVDHHTYVFLGDGC